MVRPVMTTVRVQHASDELFTAWYYQRLAPRCRPLMPLLFVMFSTYIHDCADDSSGR